MTLVQGIVRMLVAFARFARKGIINFYSRTYFNGPFIEMVVLRRRALHAYTHSLCAQE